ncbi:MAG: YkvA family protein [Anaerovoracaceae bacterium]
MQFLGFQVLIKRIKAIKFMMKDRSVPKRKKALIIFGIIYLFLPVDLIPPILFPIAWIDDLVLWLFILWYLSSELDKYWNGGKTKDYSKKYRGKKFVDDVEYEVDGKKKKEEANSNKK